MILEPKDYAFACSCGKTHTVLLKKAAIAPGALDGLEDLRAQTGLAGRATTVYDTNTFDAAGPRRPRAEQEAVLHADGLHADEHGVAQLEDKLHGDCAVLLAVGAGTVHDITRYVAAKRGIPFVSVPTAASVDGFVSTVAAMTWKGFKKTIPAVSPALLVADLSIIAKAPWQLTCAGVGDVLGKYIALADWQIANLLTGEYHCPGIARLTRAAADETVACHKGLLLGETDAYASLVRALVLSGVAMQLAGNSRPASGAEHHISHIMELGLPWLGTSPALHGEKVGVGALLATEVYSQLASTHTEAPPAYSAPYAAPTKGQLLPVFGRLTDSVLEENQNDCLLAVHPESLRQKWSAIQAVLAALPPGETLLALLKSLGAKHTLAALQVDEKTKNDLLWWSPCVRNRLTLMRMRWRM